MADINTSKIMEKVANLKRRPVRLSGYLGQASDDSAVHLYPQIDPGRYFVIPKSSVIEVLAAGTGEDERVTVLIDGAAEVECVVREYKLAEDLQPGKSPCGCGQPDGTDTGADPVGKSLAEMFIDLATVLTTMGVRDFDCSRMGASGLAHGCCEAWNALLQAIAKGGNGVEQAEYLARACYGSPE